ncbi:MAG: zinc-binding dehydrogenase [Microbacterium sp.]|uniref:zinc-binding dehydrogenase n=1 Tax=Microbacterium sp. TaxID=51671 RepID=UPI001ACDB54F|nr:zinc-binding dehydrogenase [Microbacterium sp.]MBN9177136.1 zinc-binding dehydrogenase [Microbacterium sp.]
MARRWIATAAGGPETWELVDAEAPAPATGEVTIRVAAAGVNPADAKHVAVERGQRWPVAIGYEVSGAVSAIGPDTRIGSGEVAVGDEVLAFRVQGGYATELTVDASTVFHKPAILTHPEAANLLLTGTTAAEMLAIAGARVGETIVLHGASGAVGVSILQQAAACGIRVVGTASEASFDRVRAFGGIPVAYGDGVRERIAAAADGAPLVAALDAVGTSEAIDASLALVADRSRIVTIVDPTRAARDGFRWIAGSQPDSARYRDAARARIIAAAASGALTVPVARIYPLADARAALALIASGHPGGALALVP